MFGINKLRKELFNLRLAVEGKIKSDYRVNNPPKYKFGTKVRFQHYDYEEQAYEHGIIIADDIEVNFDDLSCSIYYTIIVDSEGEYRVQEKNILNK